MEFVIAEDHWMSMYVVNNNSKQLPLVFEKDDPELIEKSFLYNAFSHEERNVIENNWVAFFFHNFAFFSPEFKFYEKVNEMYWPVLSFVQVRNGKKYHFTAAVESKKYPFIGY